MKQNNHAFLLDEMRVKQAKTLPKMPSFKPDCAYWSAFVRHA